MEHQIIGFQKGLVLDGEEMIQPEGSYSHLENGRTINYEGKNVTIQNVDGTILAFSIPIDIDEPERVVLGSCFLDDILFIFSALGDTGIGEFGYFIPAGMAADDYLLPNYTVGTYVSCVKHIDLNFFPENRIECLAERVFDRSISIYFTDNFNPPRVLNTGRLIIGSQDQYNYVIPNSFKFQIDLTLPFRMPLITIPSTPPGKEREGLIIDGGGELMAGGYRVAVRYLDPFFNKTDWSYLSNLICITDASNKNTWWKYDGAPSGTVTSKAFRVRLFDVDRSYKYIQLGVVFYDDEAVTAFADQPIEVEATTMDIIYKGVRYENIELSEFSIPTTKIRAAKTLTTVDNRMFLGNITEYQADDDRFGEIANKIKIGWEITTGETLGYDKHHYKLDENGFSVFDNKKNGSFGGYQNEALVFQKTGFFRNQWYGFGIQFVFKNGFRSFVYPIGKWQTENTSKIIDAELLAFTTEVQWIDEIAYDEKPDWCKSQALFIDKINGRDVYLFKTPMFPFRDAPLISTQHDTNGDIFHSLNIMNVNFDLSDLSGDANWALLQNELEGVAFYTTERQKEIGYQGIAMNAFINYNDNLLTKLKSGLQMSSNEGEVSVELSLGTILSTSVDGNYVICEISSLPTDPIIEAGTSVLIIDNLGQPHHYCTILEITGTDPGPFFLTIKGFLAGPANNTELLAQKWLNGEMFYTYVNELPIPKLWPVTIPKICFGPFDYQSSSIEIGDDFSTVGRMHELGGFESLNTFDVLNAPENQYRWHYQRLRYPSIKEYFNHSLHGTVNGNGLVLPGSDWNEETYPYLPQGSFGPGKQTLFRQMRRRLLWPIYAQKDPLTGEFKAFKSYSFFNNIADEGHFEITQRAQWINISLATKQIMLIGPDIVFNKRDFEYRSDDFIWAMYRSEATQKRYQDEELNWHTSVFHTDRYDSWAGVFVNNYYYFQWTFPGNWGNVKFQDICSFEPGVNESKNAFAEVIDDPEDYTDETNWLPGYAAHNAVVGFFKSDAMVQPNDFIVYGGRKQIYTSEKLSSNVRKSVIMYLKPTNFNGWSSIFGDKGLSSIACLSNYFLVQFSTHILLGIQNEEGTLSDSTPFLHSVVNYTKKKNVEELSLRKYIYLDFRKNVWGSPYIQKVWSGDCYIAPSFYRALSQAPNGEYTSCLDRVAGDVNFEFLNEYQQSKGNFNDKKESYRNASWNLYDANINMHVGAFMESAVNPHFRYTRRDAADDFYYPYSKGSEDLGWYAAEIPGRHNGRTTAEAELYNHGFSARNRESSGIPLPIDFRGQANFPTRIIYSDIKSADQRIDNYRVFRPLQFKIEDYAPGRINKIENYFGQLLCIQENAIGLLPVNQIGQVSTGITGQVQMGAVGVLPEKTTYLSRDYGSQHQWSVIKSNNAIYGVDFRNREIWTIRNNEFHGLCTEKAIKSFFIRYCERNPILGTLDSPYTVNGNGQWGIHSGYDELYREVYFTFIGRGENEESYTITFSEVTDSFCDFRFSFFREDDINPEIYLRMYQRLYCPRPTWMGVDTNDNGSSNVYELNKGNRGQFFTLDTEESVIRVPMVLDFIVNKASGLVKTYSSLTFGLEVYQKGILEEPKQNVPFEFFNRLRVITEFQNSGFVTLENRVNYRRAERKYQTAVPKDAIIQNLAHPLDIFDPANIDQNQLFKSRIRNHWCKIRVEHNNLSGNKLALSHVICFFDFSKR